MPAGRDARIDPGVFGEEPSQGELAKEEEARSELSVADLVERDLDDPTTPSRRTADGGIAEGSFSVALEELSGEPIDDR